MRRLLGLLVIVLFITLFALVIASGGFGYEVPPSRVRELAKQFLIYAYNPFNATFTAKSPEAVTSIVWDFRGLDTLFETLVFYLAIIGALSLYRGIESEKRTETSFLGLSPIVKTVTKITTGIIVAVAASIALHGHLTPGGGFQGGATAAVAPLLILIVFSKYFLENLGLRKNVLLALRSIGLLGIGMTAFSALIIGLVANSPAYVFQNQPKPDAPIGLPAYIGDSLISGTLWFFNFFEMFAVAAGFTVIFLLLGIPEGEILKQLKEEVREH